jgi:lysophospholipase-2
MGNVQKPWGDSEGQREGLNESRRELVEVIRQEVEEVGCERVIVGVISQGCAMGLHTILTEDVRVGGFFGLSGWLPSMEEVSVGGFKEMPVLLQHCKDDGVVLFANGEEMAERLGTMGLMVEWQSFEEGGHWLNEPKGMDGIVRFVKQIMAKTKVGEA